MNPPCLTRERPTANNHSRAHRPAPARAKPCGHRSAKTGGDYLEASSEMEFCRCRVWTFRPGTTSNFTAENRGLERRGCASREKPNGSCGKPNQLVSIVLLLLMS